MVSDLFYFYIEIMDADQSEVLLKRVRYVLFYNRRYNNG